MNILIFNWRDPKNPQAGGAEIVTMEHAKSWVVAGHTVTWFTSSFPGAARQETVDGVDFVRRGTVLTVHVLAPFYYFFAKQRFDVVIDEIHGFPFFTPLYVRVPIVAFIHEVADEIWEYMGFFPLNKIGRWIEKACLRLYARVPFWTDAASTVDDLVEAGISKDQCTVIPCPITNASIAKLPAKENNPTFLFVSRIVKMKGIEDVLRAFVLISKKIPTARLWVVGSGEAAYVRELKRTAHALGISSRVSFYGFVPEAKKLELMRRAHVLLHASVKEGWGLVVLETASQGTPSVVYDVAGLRDTVKDGKTGTVVTSNTPASLADAASILVADKLLYNAFQKAGLAWVNSIRWPDVTKRSLKLITSV